MIKTFQDLAAWCSGVDEQMGSPTQAVGQAFFEFRRSRIAPPSDLLCCTFSEMDGLLLQLTPHAMAADLIPLPVKMGSADIDDGQVVNFGLHPITAGLWAMSPSLNMPDIMHVFVTLYGVPDPAPWESRIILEPAR